MATYITARSFFVNEGDGTAGVALVLSAATPGGVTVTYNITYSTAQFGDITVSSGTLTFGAAETIKIIPITLANDTSSETAESFYLRLSNPVNAVIGNTTAVFTIAANDQSPGVPNASVRDVMVDERNGTALFTVVLDKPASSTVTVNWATAGLTATEGADYSAGSGVLTFLPGQTTKSIEVTLLDDATAEGDEFFAVNLSNPSGLVIAQGQGVARIGANDAPNVGSPVIIVEPGIADESAGVLDVVVRLSAPSAQEVRVNYGIGNTSTVSPEVNTGIAGTLAFAPGETFKVVRIDYDDDTSFEPTESFYLQWSGAVNAVLSNAYSFGTIVDNDSTAGTPLVGIRDVRVDEKAGVARFVVWLDKPSNDVVRVDYATTGDSAVAGSDFHARSGSIAFLPGETEYTLMIPVLDDTTAEGSERFQVDLSNPSGATLGQARGFGFIAASDNTAVAQPTVSIESIVGDETLGYVDVVVRLSAPSTQQVSVQVRDDTYSLYDEYAHSYTTTPVFAPGETEKIVRFVLRDDTESEGVHFFRAYLQTPTNAVLGNTYAMVSIAASDGATGTPLVSIADGMVDEKAGLAALVVTLDRPSVEPVSVNWATAAGNAGADADFRAGTGSLTFAPNETTKTIWLPIVDDADAEGFEFFTVLLSNPAGGTLGRHTGTVLIAPNDATAVATPVIRLMSQMVNEQDGYVDIAVLLNAPSTQLISVASSENHSYTSAENNDYSYNTNNTLNFAPGETLKLVRYHTIPDTAAEDHEGIQLLLATAVNSVIGTPVGTLTIARNNDASGVPVASVADVVVDEKTGLALFHVLLDRPSTELVVFNYTTANLSATDGDFVPRSGEMRLVPGQTLATIAVPLVDDTTAEADELFTFSISNLVNATAGQTVATGRIVSNDAANVATPVISIENALADEYNGYVDLVVRLSAPSGQQVTVTWGVDDYINNSYFDYGYDNNRVIVFAPGETSKTIRVSLVDDTTAEPAESWYAELTTAQNGVIGSSRALITLLASDNGAGGTPVVLVNDVNVDERAGSATFYFALDRPATETVSFAYNTEHISTAVGDFGLRQGRLVFQPGQTLASLTVTISDDSTPEGDEFFTISLSDPLGVALSQSQVLARIGASDNTPVSTPVITLESTVVNEIAGYVETVVRLSAPSGQQVTVDWADAYQSGSQFFNDFSYSNGGRLVFAPGETLKTIRYSLIGDTAAEPAETFMVYLTSPQNAVIGNIYSTVTIAPSDGSATTSYLRVNNVTVDEKAGSATFVVSLSQPSADIVNVGYATANGTAIASTQQAAGDYVAVSGTLSFAPGETTRRVTVPLNDDALDENEELFFLDLAAASGATIAQSRGTARIGLSDGALANTPVVSIESMVLNEDTGYAELVLRLSRPSAQQVSVTIVNDYEHVSSSNYSDFTYQNQTVVTFAPGETLKALRWAVIDDTTDEGPESFSVRLSAPSNATVGIGYGYATIANSDQASGGLPSASIGNVVVDEKDGMARFVVTLDRESTELLSFAWSTGPGVSNSATADADFTARSGTVTFWPGETTGTILVPVTDDGSNEGDEFFTVNLSAPIGGGIAQGQGTARIVANDAPNVSQPQIFVESTTVYEQAGYVDVVVRLSAPSGNQVSVTYADSYDTGVFNDYSYSTGGTLVFPAGTTVRTIRYGLADDTITEQNETFRVTLTAPVNGTLGAAQGTVTILDRDGGPVASITDGTDGIALFGSTVVYTISFSQDVTGLELSDFNLVNITGAQLTGSGASYTLTAPTTPGMEGYQLVTLKIDAVTNVSGIGNLPAGAAQQIDTLVPAITTIVPADEATGVLRDSNIVLTLSQAVQYGSGSFVLSGPQGVVQTFDVANPGTALAIGQDGVTVTLNPTNNLRYGTNYTLTMSTGALRDAAGNGVAGPVAYNFTTEPNIAPVSANGVGTTLEDTVLNGTLPAYTDANPGQTATYGVQSQGTKGTVQVNANGNYTYTPNLNANGADSFGFYVRDDEGAQSNYTVNITITPVNDAPVASNTTAAPVEDTDFAGQLPAATDVDSSNLTYSRETNAGKGQVTVNANGSWSFTPNLNANGADSFSYRIADDAGGFNVYTVTLAITPVNDAPTSSNGAVTINEDQVFSGSLPVGSDVDGDSLTYSRTAQAANGTVTVNSNGSYTYTPNAHYSGSDTFSFTVSDGRGGSATQTMQVTINAIVDTFTGTAGADTMNPFAGADIYNALAGNDTVTPGLGSDTVNGGDGIDWLSYAERPNDSPINANLRTGVVGASNESDSFTSIEGLIGSAGNDVFLGDGSNYNLFIGGDGNDTIDGGAADGSNGYNVDIVVYRGSTPVLANLQNQTATQGLFTDAISGGIEALFGGSGADTLTGINQAEARLRGETIRGGGGNDQIDGLGGVDMAEFTGPYANYTVTRPNPATSNITVTDNVGSDGSDSLVNMERLMFADQMRAFGPRAEELARVAFTLWSPGIVIFPTFFAIGFSFYDNNSYTYDQLVNVAFAVYWPEQGAAFADLLLSRQAGTTRTQGELVAVMNNAGGGAVGKRAAFDLMANEPIINNAIAATQLTGLHVGLTAPGWGDLHGLLPSAPGS